MADPQNPLTPNNPQAPKQPIPVEADAKKKGMDPAKSKPGVKQEEDGAGAKSGSCSGKSGSCS